MLHYFGDFVLGSISYRVLWVEFRKDSNVHVVRDNEAATVFRKQGWEPATIGFVRLFAGQVDRYKEQVLPFRAFQRARVAAP